MSILIKGMEMPKDGCCHRICIYADGTVSTGGRVYTAVPVPPHGKLIDESELKEWIEAWFVMHRGYHPYSKSNLIPSTEIIDIINRLPTIIEAEEDNHE